jgi:hypothetical protein
MVPEPFDLERDKRWQMKIHLDSICHTPGCFTYVIEAFDRYCLACQLDRGMPQRKMPRVPRGRPRKH